MPTPQSLAITAASPPPSVRQRAHFGERLRPRSVHPQPGYFPAQPIDALLPPPGYNDGSRGGEARPMLSRAPLPNQCLRTEVWQFRDCVLDNLWEDHCVDPNTRGPGLIVTERAGRCPNDHICVPDFENVDPHGRTSIDCVSREEYFALGDDEFWGYHSADDDYGRELDDAGLGVGVDGARLRAWTDEQVDEILAAHARFAQLWGSSGDEDEVQSQSDSPLRHHHHRSPSGEASTSSSWTTHGDSGASSSNSFGVEDQEMARNAAIAADLASEWLRIALSLSQPSSKGPKQS